MAKVNIVYHHFPHYRRPVLRELARSPEHEYRFFGCLDDVYGIKAFQGDELVTIVPLKFRVMGRLWLLKGYWRAVLDPSSDALIILGSQNMPSSWLMALAGRLFGKKILFWAHGWLRSEPLIKRTIRNLYFRLAHKVLVYSERAAVLALKTGFPVGRVSVIYNSLDFERAGLAIANIEDGSGAGILRPQSLFEDSSRPLIICTARLINACRFDLLFDAAVILREWGVLVNILLVGEGPEKTNLEKLSKDKSLDVIFYGACYDEGVLAGLIYHADLTVSPGKIGLTVIHSLTYGTPAITHGDLGEQMPEVEAITPGVSGLLFQRGNAEDLAQKIRDWLTMDMPRQQIRNACQRVIAEKWNPVNQRVLIDAAVGSLFDKNGGR